MSGESFISNQLLEIRVWDVNHGCSTWMKFPNGVSALLDCGSNPNFSPFYHLKNVKGVHDLKYLIISHPHLDHISDIKNIHYLPPRILLRPRVPRSLLAKNLQDVSYGDIFKKYLEIDEKYSQPVDDYEKLENPLNKGGVEVYSYYLNEGSYDLNDYSLVTFVKFGSFCFASGGDLTTDGWSRLIRKFESDDKFMSLLKSITVFQASHHGRQQGYSPLLFELCKPKLILISDKQVQDTSVTPLYCEVANGWDVMDETTHIKMTRHVLTTRKDGRIKLAIGTNDMGNNTNLIVTTRQVLS